MKFKKPFAKSKTVKRRTPRRKKNSRFLELTIVAVTALVIIYTISFAIRVTHGFSRTIDTPDHIVRLQILNGCGEGGAAGRIAAAIPQLTGLPIEVGVVEVTDFQSYHVEKSFIISREKNNKAAKELAKQLKLPTDNIVFEPIEDNYRSINVTLVLGDDYEKLLNRSEKKEK
jgi:predicted Zn-dependent peptidase